MDAFHSFWSVPNRMRNGGKIWFPDYELLTMILSALKWKEHNGSIKMVTDSQGADFFESNQLHDLWNEIDVSLDQMNCVIDPFLFWAAGKLYALKGVSCPCVMLDTDLIIWEKLEDLFCYDIVGAHVEDLISDVYPDTQVFKMKESYRFPQEWNFKTKAINTAFLFLKESSFRDYYVESAEIFMYSVNTDGLNPTTAMCFAEQRVLGMCAEAKNVQIKYLLELEKANQQNFITHLWGYKRQLITSYEEKERFCIRCVERIIADYPEYESVIASNKILLKYYRKCRNGKKIKIFIH